VKLQKLYKSPSTGQDCTSAQFVAEVITTRNIKRKLEQLDPAYKYWNKQHKKDYQICIVAANRLINEFGEKEVVAYILKDNFGKKLFSLGYYHPYAWLKESISNFVKKKVSLDIQSTDIPKIEEAPPEDFFIPKPRKKKTLIERLEDGKEES
jgi:hypothetical protein